ncbi:MAG: CpaF family protein [Chloroflexi bacterium]|nr:CpaF family protein [Chloroflexota bacterium]
MVNGPDDVFVERRGNIERVNFVFRDAEHLMQALLDLLLPLGDQVDYDRPHINVVLPEGRQLSAILPPVSEGSAVFIIRSTGGQAITSQDLVRFGTLTPDLAEFLRACVIARVNILVSGGIGSARMTLLNVLCGFVPGDERIVVVNHLPAFPMQQEHVVLLQVQPQHAQGPRGATTSELIDASSTLRPDRLVVSDLTGDEAYTLIQVINAGHDGTLSTIFARSTADALGRLEALCLNAQPNAPVVTHRYQIASAFDLIVHQERMRDGSRKITQISEVLGIENGQFVFQDIFRWEQTGYVGGRVVGGVQPTSIMPHIMDQIEATGIRFPPSLFGIQDQPARRWWSRLFRGGAQ